MSHAQRALFALAGCIGLSATAAAQTVEVAARAGANLQRPSWSADGTKLAFEANFHETKVIELHVGDPVAKRFDRVLPPTHGASAMAAGFKTVSKGGQVAQELSWAPASVGRFVYAASTDAQDYDLFLGGGGALARAPGADGGPAWSPDGRYIAFTSARTGQGDAYLLDTQAIEQPPRQLTTDPTASEVDLAWSADSRSLAWVAHTSVGDNVWLLSSFDGRPVRLTTWTGSQTRPSWSPKGRLVAFYANHEKAERFDLYVTEPSPSATPVKVLEGVVPNAGGPAWLPDGSGLVAVLDDDARLDPIVRVSAEGGAPTVLALGTVGNGDLDVAAGPDGRAWIAWVAQGRATDATRDFRRLYVAPLP